VNRPLTLLSIMHSNKNNKKALLVGFAEDPKFSSTYLQNTSLAVVRISSLNPVVPVS
jgi:hypothetical protein